MWLQLRSGAEGAEGEMTAPRPHLHLQKHPSSQNLLGPKWVSLNFTGISKKEAADNALGNPEVLLNQALISSFIASSNIPSACHGTSTEQTVSDNKIHPIFSKSCSLNQKGLLKTTMSYHSVLPDWSVLESW